MKMKMRIRKPQEPETENFEPVPLPALPSSPPASSRTTNRAITGRLRTLGTRSDRIARKFREIVGQKPSSSGQVVKSPWGSPSKYAGLDDEQDDD